jgi:nicotinic acid phosphoribosyltransferase
MGNDESALPAGIVTLLDTDLYKLTMQCAVLKYFPDVCKYPRYELGDIQTNRLAAVTYGYTNRTPHMKLRRGAYKWLLEQMESKRNIPPISNQLLTLARTELANVRVTAEEREFLRQKCPYLNDAYITFLETFHLKPAEQIDIKFTPTQDTGSDDDEGDVEYIIKGLWLDTILYEIPLLALTSQAYFMFSDKDWDYKNQEEKAYRKGCTLLENGCVFSEFGSRRRRDHHTQDLVMKGLTRAAEEGKRQGWAGALSGTSNVHFAMKYGVPAVGTVAHEWYMAIAAITDDYENANELALKYWLGCFGEGVCIPAVTMSNVLDTNRNTRSLVSHLPIHSVHRLSWMPSKSQSQYRVSSLIHPLRLMLKFTLVSARTPVTRPTLSRWPGTSMMTRVSPIQKSSCSRILWISSTALSTRPSPKRQASSLHSALEHSSLVSLISTCSLSNANPYR